MPRYGALGVMNDFRGVTSAYGYGDSYLVPGTMVDGQVDGEVMGVGEDNFSIQSLGPF